MLIQNMYQNPVLNAPIGPDGLPMPVEQDYVQEHYEVSTFCCRLVAAFQVCSCLPSTTVQPWQKEALSVLSWLAITLQFVLMAVPMTVITLPLRLQDFYEDVFEELDQYGEIENLNVCDNLADHMVGNVYVKFKDEESAARALQAMQGRYYAGRPILAEFSPVTDFREATCRQYEENTCNRGGYCNFMHIKSISKELRKILFGRYKRRDRSNSPE